MISYKGLTEAEVLVALYHGTWPQGLGIFHNVPRFNLYTAMWFIETTYPQSAHELPFDYVYGRPIKVTLLRDQQEIYHEHLYDRDSLAPCAEVIAAALEAKNDSH